jgi:hypothetical protein
MKKLYTITLASVVASTLLCAGDTVTTGTISEAVKLDVKVACNPKLGVKKLLATAKKFNPTAIKNEIEFMRFKVPNSKAIKAIEKTIKEGKTTVALLKKKKYTLTSVDDASWRACVFAIRPLQMAAAAEENYHLAIPGDKYTY